MNPVAFVIGEALLLVGTGVHVAVGLALVDDLRAPGFHNLSALVLVPVAGIAAYRPKASIAVLTALTWGAALIDFALTGGLAIATLPFGSST